VARVDRKRQHAEIGLPEDQRDYRGQQVRDEGFDDQPKRGPDHNRHRQVDHVPTEQELLEIAEQTHDTTSRISCSRRRTLPPERVSIVTSRSESYTQPKHLKRRLRTRIALSVDLSNWERAET
jgi:hypothetical protein